MTVNVTERQFAFEFSYPQANGKQVVSPDLYLAKGQPVVFKLRSLDVIHSFFVPEFSEKIDAVPGHHDHAAGHADPARDLPAECTELCGAGPLADARGRHMSSARRASKHGCSPRSPMGRRRSAHRRPMPLSPEFPAPHRPRPRPRRAPAPRLVGVIGYGRGEGRVHLGRLQRSCHTLAAAGATGTVGPDLEPPADRLRQRGVQADPGGHSRGVHPHRDHQTLRVHPDRLPRRNHAGDLRPDAVVRPRYKRLSTSCRAWQSEQVSCKPWLVGGGSTDGDHLGGCAGDPGPATAHARPAPAQAARTRAGTGRRCSTSSGFVVRVRRSRS